MRSILPAILALILVVHNDAAAQQVTIPAYTGYAVPAEAESEDSESILFYEKTGLHNWKDKDQQLDFYFKVRTAGRLQIALLMKAPVSGNKLTATIAGKKFTVNVPFSKTFRSVNLGSVVITDTGFYSITLKGMSAANTVIADIRSLQLSGPATNRLHYNPTSRRNAASVHLLYPLPDSNKVIGLYNEINVPAGADPLHTYYMGCGFARGYFGIQVNSEAERRVIFSVWDAGDEAVDRNKVNAENRVQLIAKGDAVVANDFGNEGTGGHSHWIFPWKTNNTYRFYVTAVTDSVKNTTDYAGYFFAPELQRWKLIAVFRAPKDGKTLRNLYAFSENFVGNNGQLERRAFFGNTWVRLANGEWKEITNARFSQDATGRNGDRIDHGAGSDSTRFYLWNGGFRQADAIAGQEMTRIPNGQRPVIDLYRDADSALTATADAAAIKQYTTQNPGEWKNDNGVTYRISSPAEGPAVTIKDTLIVHYKGQLLNGFVFDQTKEKPAAFPLKRLIRGWQAALVHARKGEKVQLLIPSAQAYSIRHLGEIPPNSTLLFDIEIVDIKPGK